MKKLLLIAMALVATFTAKAETKQYTVPMTIRMNAAANMQEGDIVIETLDNGNINFTLKNFVYESAATPVGNITLNDIQLNDATDKDKGPYKRFSISQSVAATAGDKAGIDAWQGPALGELSIAMIGQMQGDDFYGVIEIDVTPFYGAKLYVEIGNPLCADHYSDQLSVTINEEESDPIDATVTVVYVDDNHINFILKNFSLNSDMHVGNIVVNNLELKADDGYNTFEEDGEIYITAGDIEGVSEDSYMGPMISPVPIVLKGKINDNKLYVTIDIDMMDTMLEQFIYVVYGTDIPSGISSISKMGTTSKIYDLTGRQANTIQKGISIVNGRKVVR